MKWCSPLTEDEQLKLDSISDLDLGWVAGILEGEGSFFAYERPGRAISPRISMASTDRDVLERLLSLLGGGLGNEFQRVRRKPISSWVLGRKPLAHAWMVKLAPYMGQRRASKIQEVLIATGAVTV